MKKTLFAIGLFLMTVGIASAHTYHQKHTPVPPPSTGNSITFTAYLTSYAAGDNSPAGTGTYIDGISGNAGGIGTYSSPITIAVGYVGQTADFAPGTMFYVPVLQKYFIAGDTCADCHSDVPKGTTVHLDMWAGNYSGKGVLSCEDAVTGNYTVIENPPSNEPVSIGGLYNGSACVL